MSAGCSKRSADKHTLPCRALMAGWAGGGAKDRCAALPYYIAVCIRDAWLFPGEEASTLQCSVRGLDLSLEGPG